ncbi:MAG: efflux RND transporter periplasmic adaptor subunit [Halioglobus sp.]|nr:efflux RND transporter periplasmic adaptor subunit [Halioglobus sp.]
MAQSSARKGILALAVLLLGGALAYGLLVGKPRPAPQEVPVLPPPLVEVVAASPAERSLAVRTQGTVRPLREIKLMSQVGGLVESVGTGFARGAFFAADEMLVKIEDVDYRFAIARAESQVAAARQRLAEEEGRALQAKREWRDLGTDSANALFLRKPQIAAAEAALRASEADLAAARKDLARTVISGPFNGRVIEKHVDIGQFVTPGTAIATVYDTDVAQIRLPLTDRQVALLDLPLSYAGDDVAPQATPVTLSARFANRLWEWQGRMVRTDASIDENSRVVYAVVEVDQPFSRGENSERPPLSPGLFVDAVISGHALPGVSELPRSALHNDDTVMVVDSELRTSRRAVRVLDSTARQVWVQGLHEGDRVIVRQPPNVVAGMTVRLHTPGELADGSL